jgi:bacterial/archaeal transporter family-2 protein
VDRNVALVVAVSIGAAVAAQAPLNARLGTTVGGLPATCIALGVSFTALLLLTTATGKLSGLGQIGDAPVWAIAGGGLIGGLYVGSIVWTVRALGAGGLTAATVAGQLGFAIAIDHFGWLGVDRSPVTVAKLAGVALLAAGTYLVVAE